MSKNSGIYQIKNIIDGKIYIGKSKNISKRFGEHLRCLRDNKDRCILLQRAVNKHGLENFIFSLIEECEEENLNKKEIYWIKYLKSSDKRFGYNIHEGGFGGDTISKNPNRNKIIRKNALLNLGCKHINKNGIERHVKKEEVEKFLKEGWALGGANINNQYEKHSLFMKNNNPMKNPKTVQKMCESLKPIINSAKYKKDRSDWFSGAGNPRARTFIFISPDLVKFEVKGELSKFCKDHKIDRQKIKKNRIYKGWQIFEKQEFEKMKEQGFKIKKCKYPHMVYIFISPDKQVYKMNRGVEKFCKQHNLNNTSVWSILGKRRKNNIYKGWVINKKWVQY